MMTSLALSAPHRADLAASGLTDETIAEAGLYTARPGDLHRLCGRDVPDGTSGLVLPYDRTFARVKVFPPINGADGRAIKYLQPAGSPVRAYMVGLAPSVRTDAAIPIRITEGEKKSLALCQAGFPTIGLGGIWNFRAKGLPPDALIADLEAVAWRGRSVLLAPDSDASTNTMVLLAVYRLGTILTARGAAVRVVQLPEGQR